MVRTTTRDDESDTNDATRFVREQIQSEKAVESFDAVDKVGGHHTADTSQFGDDDFDDDGNYDGDDPVDVVLRVTVDGDAPAYKVRKVVDALTERGFDVSGPEVNRSWSAPVDTSGTFDKPAGTSPEDDASYNHRFEYTARKRVHDADDSIWQAANEADRRLAEDGRL